MRLFHLYRNCLYHTGHACYYLFKGSAVLLSLITSTYKNNDTSILHQTPRMVLASIKEKIPAILKLDPNLLLHTILNFVMRSRLFWGFMISSTVGIGYIFVVYRLLQKYEDSQFSYGTVRGVRIDL